MGNVAPRDADKGCGHEIREEVPCAPSGTSSSSVGNNTLARHFRQADDPANMCELGHEPQRALSTGPGLCPAEAVERFPLRLLPLKKKKPAQNQLQRHSTVGRVASTDERRHHILAERPTPPMPSVLGEGRPSWMDPPRTIQVDLFSEVFDVWSGI